MARRVIPVILSGGSGTRLWPLSRAARPKQLLALTGDRTLLQLTVARTADPDLFAPPVIVANAAHADLIEEQVGEETLGGLILEPAPRNTAPAIALAALAAAREDLLLVLPSDHLIQDAAGFRSAVVRAVPFAEDGWLVTFGMKAQRPETGYGYIQRGAELAPGVMRAERFVEKPDLATAKSYCAAGDHDWNGGIFLFRAGDYLDALGRHAPDMAGAAQGAVAAARHEGKRLFPDERRFRASPAQSIDYAVMEKADRIAVVPVAIGWSDVGSWEALYEVLDKDPDGNAVVGEAMLLDASRCLVRSEGPLVALVGVEDLVVVATPAAVLVLPRRESQRVKEVVEGLKAQANQDQL